MPISTATQTAIPNPTGIAEDTNGNIYVASQYSYYVYQVNPATGAFQPIAGTGIFGYSGAGEMYGNASRLLRPGCGRCGQIGELVRH